MYLVKSCKPCHETMQHNNDDSVVWQPHVDVIDTQDAFEMLADLPGLSKENIKIHIKDQVLIIEGEKKDILGEDEKLTGIRERLFGKFKRSFKLSNGIEADKIDASYNNGVLRVKLPKAEQVKPREIEIQ